MATAAFAHRGVMLDLARLTERHDYYYGLLPYLKEWGHNLVHLHFTDDQGCALEFPSHPELASPHAFTADEMRRFCAEAGKHGLEVVPEIECFGHTGFITRNRKYRHLLEVSQGPGRYGGMCVFEPEAQALLEDLLRDTMEIFEPRLIHVGLDEVEFGQHPTSKKLLKKTQQTQLFAGHIAWCHDVVTDLGARMAIWGDHLLHDRREGVIADGTPKDTIIFDWHYEPGFDPWSMDFFIDRGFEVYGAPATQRCNNRIISSAENFQNLREFSSHGLARRRASRSRGKVTGMVATIWCPHRYVPGTIEYPAALAGRLFGWEDLEPVDFPADFAAGFWGLKGRTARDVGEAVHALHMAAPTRREYERILFGSELGRWRSLFGRSDRHLCRERLGVVQDAGRCLQSAAGKTKRNTGRMYDLVTAAEFLWRLYAFGLSGRAADVDWRGLRKSMQRSWARTRYGDGPHYAGKSARVPMGRWDADSILRHLNRLAG
jgi:hypothetical protein